MEAFKFLIAASILLCVTTTPFAAETSSDAQTVKRIQALTMNGKQLRAEIDRTYQQLQSSKTLNRGHDVTTIVLKYLPLGSSIDDAKAVLHAAGATDSLTVRGHLFFSVRIGGHFLSSVSFCVDIAPNSDGVFTVVHDVSGAIIVEYV
jgi:hypothetical protein